MRKSSWVKIFMVPLLRAPQGNVFLFHYSLLFHWVFHFLHRAIFISYKLQLFHLLLLIHEQVNEKKHGVASIFQQMSAFLCCKSALDILTWILATCIDRKYTSILSMRQDIYIDYRLKGYVILAKVTEKARSVTTSGIF